MSPALPRRNLTGLGDLPTMRRMDEFDITLTELDVQRLTPILKVHEAGYGQAAVRQLRAKMGRAPVIPAAKVPPTSSP